MTVPKVLIVGGGLIALATAWRAAMAGYGVTVLANGAPAASEAAAGMLAPSFEAIHRRATAATHALLVRALPFWDAFAPELEAASRINIDYRRNGIIGLDGAAMGLPVDVPDGFSARVAHLVEREGQVDPRRLLTALRHALQIAGVPILRVEAIAIPEAPAPSVVLADGGALSSDVLVIAAGALSPFLVQGAPALVGVRGRAFLVDAPHQALAHVVRTRETYFCPKADGTLYIGATEEPVSGTDERPLDDLWQQAVAAFPALATMEPVRRFDGVRPATATGLPVLQRLPMHARIIAAYGHDRNGVLLTPWTAMEVLGLIRDSVG